MQFLAFSNFVNKLSTNGRAVSQIANCQEATTLGENLFIVEEFLGNRQKLMSEIGDDFVAFVVRLLQSHEKKMLGGASEGMIVQIVGGSLTKVIDELVKLDLSKGMQDHCACIYFALTSTQSKNHFGLSWVSDSAAATQARLTVLHLAEKILRVCSFEQAVEMGKALCLFWDIKEIDLVELQENKGAKLSNGWFMQPYWDLQTLIVCLLVQEFANDNNKVMPHYLRNACVQVFQHSTMCSARLKSLFKTVNGSHRQLGKIAWDYIEEASSRHAIHLEVSSPSNIDDLKGVLDILNEDLTSMSDASWCDLTNDLADLLEDSGSKLTALADAYGGNPLDTNNDEQVSIGKILVDTPRVLIQVMSKLLSSAPLSNFNTSVIFNDVLLSSEWYSNWKRQASEAGSLTEDLH